MKKRLIISLISCIVAFVLLLIYLFLNQRQILVLGCTIYKTTGYACPTCGFTDLLQSLIKADFSSAFAQNPYMFTTLPLWFYIVIRYLWHYIHHGNLMNSKKINIITIILIISGVIFGILRNFI